MRERKGKGRKEETPEKEVEKGRKETPCIKIGGNGELAKKTGQERY